TITVPAKVPPAEAMPLARKYQELHTAGRDDLIPYKAMELTTVVAEAARMCNLEHGPYSFDLTLTGLCIGDVALVGFPGEPFTAAGVMTKEAPGWKAIMPCALTNGAQGYFPMKEAFDEGGYEARSSMSRRCRDGRGQRGFESCALSFQERTALAECPARAVRLTRCV
ncbi:MAG: hypothetical protein IKV48_00970, partial [Eggerthellaceae bacterium]|nr:hypothetical protein [Eggerthellaceae bacterium]